MPIASAAGLANFLATTSAAFATSLMPPAWDNPASVHHSTLAGSLNRPNEAIAAMTAQGLTHDQALHQLDGIVQVQSVMLSTNQMFLATSAIFVVAAMAIWFAPRPVRVVGPGGGH